MAQLVERDLAKVEAAGSSPVSRFCFVKKGIRWVLFFVQKEPLFSLVKFCGVLYTVNDVEKFIRIIV